MGLVNRVCSDKHRHAQAIPLNSVYSQVSVDCVPLRFSFFVDMQITTLMQNAGEVQAHCRCE